MSLLRSPSKKQPTPLPSAEDSLLIPANPALVNPGSSPTSRGGILLNPLGGNKDSGSHLRGTSPGGGASASSSGGSRPARWLSRTASSMSSSTTATATSSTSDGTSVESSAATSVAPSNASSSSPSLKFAPLPVSGRKRSSSIALGVASRAAMLQGVNGNASPQQQQQYSSNSGFSAPHWQQGCAPVRSTWYNGGPMPDNVKTVKDIKPGLKKAWGKIRRGSSASRGSDDSKKSRSDSVDSTASTSSDTTSDMSAADERTADLSSSYSDSSSMISSSSIGEEDEEALAAEDAEQEAARGRPAGRLSPVHMHSGNAFSSHTTQFGGSALSSSPEHHAHFMGGTASGDATPRRRHSPVSHPHAAPRYGRSQPTSGENTPRRRMSLSDVHGGDDQARADRHHQAVFGFDKKLLNSRFDKLGLQRLGSGQGQEGSALGEELDTTYSRESENSLGESDEPIPDSKQVQGAATEIAV